MLYVSLKICFVRILAGNRWILKLSNLRKVKMKHVGAETFYHFQQGERAISRTCKGSLIKRVTYRTSGGRIWCTCNYLAVEHSRAFQPYFNSCRWLPQVEPSQKPEAEFWRFRERTDAIRTVWVSLPRQGAGCGWYRVYLEEQHAYIQSNFTLKQSLWGQQVWRKFMPCCNQSSNPD